MILEINNYQLIKIKQLQQIIKVKQLLINI
jgi:hypothetical protein